MFLCQLHFELKNISIIFLSVCTVCVNKRETTKSCVLWESLSHISKGSLTQFHIWIQIHMHTITQPSPLLNETIIVRLTWLCFVQAIVAFLTAWVKLNRMSFFFQICVWKSMCYVSTGQKSRRWRSTSVSWRRDSRRWGNAERLIIKCRITLNYEQTTNT